MKLTNRDLEILKLINKFGYINHTHLKEYLGVSKVRAYQIANRLINNNFIERLSILSGEPAIYICSRSSCKDFDYKYSNSISLGVFKHNILLVSLYLDLIKKYQQNTILSDRDLTKINGFKGVGSYGHIPDLVIQTEQEKNGYKDIAVELELTRKSKKRVQNIVKELDFKHKYLEVFYFCNSDTYEYIKGLTSGAKHIKVFSLEQSKEPSLNNDINEKIEYLQSEIIDKNKIILNLKTEIEILKKGRF